MSIADNLAAVQARIAAAAGRAGRDPASVTLLPISKTVPEARLREAIAAGLPRLGENRVQEAKGKAEALADLGPRWTVVGHLQTNKVKAMLSFADEFQALDSLRLAEALDRVLQSQGRALDVHVQINTSAEESKFGLEPEALPGFLREMMAFPSLRVRGLMTLAAFTPDEAVVRACFRRLRTLATAAEQTLGQPLGLSMGMSGDYEAAIEEGATVVRVGQAIFGHRATPDSFYWPEAV
jgi:pyridoxal phosphate enzyme (YggS family)